MPSSAKRANEAVNGADWGGILTSTLNLMGIMQDCLEDGKALRTFLNFLRLRMTRLPTLAYEDVLFDLR